MNLKLGKKLNSKLLLFANKTNAKCFYVRLWNWMTSQIHEKARSDV